MVQLHRVAKILIRVSAKLKDARTGRQSESGSLKQLESCLHLASCATQALTQTNLIGRVFTLKQDVLEKQLQAGQSTSFAGIPGSSSYLQVLADLLRLQTAFGNSVEKENRLLKRLSWVTYKKIEQDPVKK